MVNELCVYFNFLPGCSSSSLLKFYPVNCLLMITLIFFSVCTIRDCLYRWTLQKPKDEIAIVLVRRGHYREASKGHLDIRAHLG